MRLLKNMIRKVSHNSKLKKAFNKMIRAGDAKSPAKKGQQQSCTICKAKGVNARTCPGNPKFMEKGNVTKDKKRMQQTVERYMKHVEHIERNGIEGIDINCNVIKLLKNALMQKHGSEQEQTPKKKMMNLIKPKEEFRA